MVLILDAKYGVVCSPIRGLQGNKKLKIDYCKLNRVGVVMGVGSGDVMKKNRYCSVLLLGIFILLGCNQPEKIDGIKVVNTSETIQYQISLERQTLVKLSSSDNLSSEPQKMTENLNFILSCQPSASDDKGVISCKLTFESIQAKKVDFIQTGRSTDSAMGLNGKSFRVSVTSDGIVSSPQLEQELKLLSNNSFEDVKRPGVRLKYPDFLQDMWSVQALLLESIVAGKDENKSGFQACQCIGSA
jgi:hypothetical protein